MTLYSPSFTSKPSHAVKAEYSSPSEWGKRASCVRATELGPAPPKGPAAVPVAVVVHSPTPSTVRRAASSKGEQKKALAAWDTWWSTKRIFSGGTPRFFWMNALTQSFSSNQVIMDSPNVFHERGNDRRVVVRMRSNLTRGFS